jgi:tetratricopeptide (TPR) repeat protein
MSKHRLTAILLFASLWLFLCSSAFSAQKLPSAIRPGNNVLAARGFNELYNMDYDPAIRDFVKLQSQYPDDPFTSNYLLAAEVFKELNRIGALDTETYSSESFLTSKARRPLDTAAQKRIFDLVARVESLCNARLQKNPNDTDALYARGVARGFRSTYMGMAEKSWMAAIRSALASRRDHERVLELDPSYLDAKMTVGIHNYIIGSLNWAGRAAVALVGVTGNRQKGLDYLREVSRSHGTSSNDAALALSLFLRREQRYPEALELVSRVSREYPRNFLLVIEYAHLLNAAGHGREAIAQYNLVLQKGREGRYSTFQPELVAWGLGISQRGQHEFAKAASSFDLVTTVGSADPALIDRANVAAGEMYDTLGQRDVAIAHYRRALDGGREGDYVSAAHKHLRRPYHFSEPSISVQ